MSTIKISDLSELQELNSDPSNTYMIIVDVPSNSTMKITSKTLSNSIITNTLFNLFPINVKNYGAVGDGITDDTLAIQSAINSAENLSIKKDIYIPSGVYKISSPLVINSSNLCFYGDGQCSIIRQTTDNDIIQLDGSNQILSYLQIRDLWLELDNTIINPISCAAIRFLVSQTVALGIQRSTIRNIDINNVWAGIVINDGKRELWSGIYQLDPNKFNNFDSIRIQPSNNTQYGILWQGAVSGHCCISNSSLRGSYAVIKAGQDSPTCAVGDFRIIGNSIITSTRQYIITSISDDGLGGPVTVVTNTPHNLSTIDAVSISNVSTLTEINGRWFIDVKSPTSFTLRGVKLKNSGTSDNTGYVNAGVGVLLLGNRNCYNYKSSLVGNDFDGTGGVAGVALLALSGVNDKGNIGTGNKSIYAGIENSLLEDFTNTFDYTKFSLNTHVISSNTTYRDISDLSFQIPQFSTGTFDLLLRYASLNSADIKIKFKTDGLIRWQTSSGGYWNISGVWTAAIELNESQELQVAGFGVGYSFINIKGIVLNQLGNTSVTITPQFAQVTSNVANTTIAGGSYLRVQSQNNFDEQLIYY